MNTEELMIYKRIIAELKQHNEPISIIHLNMNLEIDLSDLNNVLKMMNQNDELLFGKDFNQLKLK